MKPALLVLIAACCLLELAAAADSQPIRLAVELTDGSRVIGTSPRESIRIRSEIGELHVSLRLVDQVRWKADREHVVVEFPNGDRLTGGIVPEVVSLDTLFGEANVSMEHIVLIKPLPAPLAGIHTLDGLELYFSFDEKPQSTIIASRVGPHGKQQGGQWIPLASGGGAFEFTSANDAIRLADHQSLRPKQLTIAVWVKPDRSSGASSYRGILAKGTPGSWMGGYGLAQYPGSSNVHFFVNYYGTQTAHAPIPEDRWTHLAGTYDEQTLTLYVNGQKASAAIPQGSYGGPIQHGNSPLLIGQAPDGYGWFGTIDEVMLFNRVLSPEEISRLYQLTRKD